ncbi:MAG: CesT family type III secretion system chaperone [Verrucomicrobiales bacterium]|nr:CesT family type III secretion system chaperone [Verrucomicrobiales bacterium]
MTNTDTVNHWLASLNPDLRLNEAGYCSLSNGDVALVAEVPETTGCCHLFGVVMPPPEGVNLALWLQEALRLNLMGRPLLGAWLAFDPDENALFLCQNLRIASSTAEDFAAVTGTLAEIIPSVRDHLTPSLETLAEMREEAALAEE